MNGGSSDRTPRGERPNGLIRGVLDFELDIGVVGDVDPDPLAKNLLSDPADSFSAVTAPGMFTLPLTNWLSIQGTEHGQSLFVGQRRVSLPPEWSNPEFPFVRGLADGRILISDTSFEASHTANTWILSRTGEVLARFGIGSAAVEISPLDGGLIAVAYHPLSAQKFGHRVEPQQRTAIAFFDEQGKLLTTFNHEAGRTHCSAENVRCMTRISPLELVFIPERLTNRGQDIENPVVFYHCATGRTVVFSAPFGASEAVSVARGLDGAPWVLLASPEGFEDQVIAFDPARKISQYLGAFTGIFRGLAGQPFSPRHDTRQGAHDSMAFGGFLAQEVVSEYQWVLADPESLPRRDISARSGSSEGLRSADRPEDPGSLDI
jgi:hypothetical protein